jgi:hypothetical protein
MAKSISIEMIHEDLEILKRDFAELKTLLLEPKIRKEILKTIKEARKRMKTNYVTNESLKKEFGV